MLNRMNKNWQAHLLLWGAFLFYPLAYAQEAPQMQYTPTPVSLESVSEEIKKMLQDQEDVDRALLQDWKNFFGLNELKRIETQNIMRLMITPFFDQTVTLGARVFAAQETLEPWQAALVVDTANYNMNTPASESDDVNFLSQRMDLGEEAMINPAAGGLNDLLASTLLSGRAFENDAKAEQAYQFIQHLTNFQPIPAKTTEELFDADGVLLPGAGDHLMSLYKQLPTMTMAQNSLLAIHADKQRFVGFAADLPIGDPQTQSASLMEVMAYEVERRYMSQAWYESMNQMSAEGIMREIAFMMAFQNYLGFKSYEQGMRTEALLAAQMGVMSNVLGMGAIGASSASLLGE